MEEAVEGEETAGMKGTLPQRAKACPQEWAQAKGTVMNFQVVMFVKVLD